MIDKTNLRTALIQSIETGNYMPVDHTYSARVKVTDGKTVAMVIDHWSLTRLSMVTANTPVIDHDLLTHIVDEMLEGLNDEPKTEVDGIDIYDLVQKFEDAYDLLCSADLKGLRLPGYEKALEDGDRLIRENKELVAEFNKRRHDMLTSDREVAAFAIAVNNMTA